MGVRGALPRWCAILAATVVGLLLAGASPAAAPDNDNFSAAASLRAATGTVFGTNVDATVEAGEPAHTGNAGGASAWYRWVAPYTGVATFDTFGSGFDTLLAVYTGSSVNALTPVASNDDALGFKWTSQAGFPVTAGTAYYVAVDGYNDGTNGPARGTFALNWDLAPSAGVTQPNDMFASAVPLSGPAGSVAGSSFGATSESGEPIHAAVGGGRSVWFRWTAPYDAQFTFSTDGSAFNTVLAAYTGIAVNGLSQTAADDDIAWNDQQSLITINASQGTTYSIAIDGWKTTYSGTASGDYLLTWMPLSPPQNVPANDAFVNAQALSGASGAVSSSSLSAGKEPGEPNHGGNLGGASVWYSWTAPVSGNVDVSTAGSNFDTLLGVYTGTAVNALSQVAGNDDVGPGKGPSEVVFAATAGTTYRIAVDGYSAPGGLAGQGDFVLAWSVAAGAAPSNDDFDSAMTIVGTGGIVNKSNLGATKEPGEPAHASNAGGASVWFRYVAPADGQWRFYTSGSTFNTLLAVYTGDSVDQLSLVAANDDVSATDRSSSVTITARAQTTYWIAVDGYRTANGPAASGDYSFLWELLGPDPALAPNDDFAWAWQLNGSYGPVTASNVLATKQAGEPDHAGNAGGASVWFKWTPPSSGPVYFDTPGSSFDTTLAVYTGTALNDLHEVAANDNIAYNLWWPTGQYRESYVSFYAQLGTIYYIAVDGHADPGGAPARGSIFLDWWLSSPPGDATLLAAGSISRCDAANDEATGALLGQYPDATVAALGDLTNVAGTAAEFGCYDQSWGAAKSRTRPVPGNQDYGTAGAAPYYSYFGAQAGAQGLGYYSYDLGGWHVVALNTNCSQVGGCGAGSPEEQWLRQDLRANANSCTVAYMHDSLFTSSGQPATAVQPLWQALYDNGADLVLSGDSHYYERFAPQTPAGAADSTKGIAEFIVGTGGAALTSLPSTRAANSQVVNASSYGVLKLLLHPSGYEWQFLPAGGSTFTDTGRGACAGGGSGGADGEQDADLHRPVLRLLEGVGGHPGRRDLHAVAAEHGEHDLHAGRGQPDVDDVHLRLVEPGGRGHLGLPRAGDRRDARQRVLGRLEPGRGRQDGAATADGQARPDGRVRSRQLVEGQGDGQLSRQRRPEARRRDAGQRREHLAQQGADDVLDERQLHRQRAGDRLRRPEVDDELRDDQGRHRPALGDADVPVVRGLPDHEDRVVLGVRLGVGPRDPVVRDGDARHELPRHQVGERHGEGQGRPLPHRDLYLLGELGGDARG